jgi:hypothetical protein
MLDVPYSGVIVATALETSPLRGETSNRVLPHRTAGHRNHWLSRLVGWLVSNNAHAVVVTARHACVFVPLGSTQRT